MNIVKVLLFAVLLVLCVGGYGLYQELKKAVSEDPTVWEDAISDFEDAIEENPAKEDSLLFIGSSSIRLWDTLAEDMQPFDVVQRGFGGAKLLDVVHFADRLIDIGVRPAALIVFVGTNDISPDNVKEPELLLQRYQQFVAVLRAKYADVPVYYIAITPSVLRWSVWSFAQETNRLIKEYSDSEQNLFVIDTSNALLGENGEPDPKLYQFDGLHLSEEGYARWTATILPRLLDDLRPGEQP